MARERVLVVDDEEGVRNSLRSILKDEGYTVEARRGPPGSVRLEVADDGPGIREEDRDRLFLPYFSTKKKGTGLGLAIVHRIVSDHHGRIHVEHNKPHGARFVIELPVAAA